MAPSTTAFMLLQYLLFALPANQATVYNTGPFSLFTFAGHTPTIVVPAMPPPMQAETWQAAYTTTLGMQQQLHERVAELTHHNSAAQAEVDRLRQEKTELQCCVQETEQKFVQHDLELTRYNTSESDIIITGDSLSTHDAMLQSSECTRIGLPDPSVEMHPQSDWYLWYRTPGASMETVPEFSDSPTTKPGASLPLWAAKYIGAKAEAMEKKHISKAEQAMDKGLQTPQHDRTPPDLGPWTDVVITTANQAHNLHHLAVNKQDKFAARAYREYNWDHQNPLVFCTEGRCILMYGHTHDLCHFPADAYYSKAGHVTTVPTPALPALSRSPASAVTVPDLTTIRCVLPTIIPSDTDTTFCTPIADDVVAEVYITSLLPVVPANQPERYSESTFFRRLVELFLLYDVYDWLVKHGEYNQLLIKDPAPYPFDCEDLGLYHVAAWICSHNIAAHPPLKSWVTNYAANVCHLLEGCTGSDRLCPFKTMPTRSSNIAQDCHIVLVPSYHSLLQAART
ncbi:hypothetical protein LXA43DRAFT_1099191 [Ganoderma leucocontextum]|nr:hypothetical protein LXA43DRAFT_1099191 [Ganoderma leucocontextum]